MMKQLIRKYQLNDFQQPDCENSKYINAKVHGVWNHVKPSSQQASRKRLDNSGHSKAPFDNTLLLVGIFLLTSFLPTSWDLQRQGSNFSHSSKLTLHSDCSAWFRPQGIIFSILPLNQLLTYACDSNSNILHITLIVITCVTGSLALPDIWLCWVCCAGHNFQHTPPELPVHAHQGVQRLLHWGLQQWGLRHPPGGHHLQRYTRTGQCSLCIAGTHIGNIWNLHTKHPFFDDRNKTMVMHICVPCLEDDMSFWHKDLQPSALSNWAT